MFLLNLLIHMLALLYQCPLLLVHQMIYLFKQFLWCIISAAKTSPSVLKNTILVWTLSLLKLAALIKFFEIYSISFCVTQAFHLIADNARFFFRVRWVETVVRFW